MDVAARELACGAAQHYVVLREVVPHDDHVDDLEVPGPRLLDIGARVVGRTIVRAPVFSDGFVGDAVEESETLDEWGEEGLGLPVVLAFPVNREDREPTRPKDPA